MSDHAVRLYAVALGVLVFFLSWAVVAARPWGSEASARDPRLVALERRELKLRRESVQVQRLVKRRFARYQVRLAERQREIAAVQSANATAAAAPSAPASGASAASPAPSVGVVSLPPVTSTSTS